MQLLYILNSVDNISTVKKNSIPLLYLIGRKFFFLMIAASFFRLRFVFIIQMTYRAHVDTVTVDPLSK